MSQEIMKTNFSHFGKLGKMDAKAEFIDLMKHSMASLLFQIMKKNLAGMAELNFRTCKDMFAVDGAAYVFSTWVSITTNKLSEISSTFEQHSRPSVWYCYLLT